MKKAKNSSKYMDRTADRRVKLRTIMCHIRLANGEVAHERVRFGYNPNNRKIVLVARDIGVGLLKEGPDVVSSICGVSGVAKDKNKWGRYARNVISVLCPETGVALNAVTLSQLKRYIQSRRGRRHATLLKELVSMVEANLPLTHPSSPSLVREVPHQGKKREPAVSKTPFQEVFPEGEAAFAAKDAPMSQTLMDLSDHPAGIEASAQRPPRNTVPASVTLKDRTIVRNPWQDAQGDLVPTTEAAAQPVADPETVWRETTETCELMAHWRKLKANYEADPSEWLFGEVEKLAGHIQRTLPGILDIEPMPAPILPVQVMDMSEQLAPPPESAGALVPAGTVITNPTPGPEAQRGGYLLPQQTYATAQEGVRVFMFDGHPVRTGGDPKNPWFCVIDVLKALDDKPGPKRKYNATEALKGLAGDEFILNELTDVTGRQQDMACVYKSGLWFLIGKSRKPSAAKFQAWVRKEVLKQIDETGTFSLPGIQRDNQMVGFTAMIEVIGQIGKGVEAAVARLGNHESQLTIHGSQLRDQGSQINSLGERVTIVDERMLRIEAENNTLKRDIAEIEMEIIRTGGRLRERPVEAEPEGESPGVRANEVYLAVDAFRLRYYPNGFVTSGLTMDNHRFGIRASQLCRQRGIKVEYWFCGNGNARCYPVSILREVANECRRTVDPAVSGDVALAS